MHQPLASFGCEKKLHAASLLQMAAHSSTVLPVSLKHRSGCFFPFLNSGHFLPSNAGALWQPGVLHGFGAWAYDMAPGCFTLGATLQPMHQPLASFGCEKKLHAASLLQMAAHSSTVLPVSLKHRSGCFFPFLNSGHFLPSNAGALWQPGVLHGFVSGAAGVGLGFALQPFAPSLVKPAEQPPHVATPPVLVHARLLSQPPLFVLHGSAGAGFLQSLAPSLIRGAGQSPHVATPSVLVHARLLSQPPFSITHASTHCAVFTASAFPVAEGFLFSQQVLK